MLLGFRFLFVLSLASAFLKISKISSRFTPLHSASSSSSDISKLKPPTNAFAYSAISIIKQGFFDILLPLPKKEISLTADDSDSAMTPILRQSLIRFFVLETIARTPYFAYLSVLHLLETLGIDRQLKEGNNVELMRVHFAEGINEGVHLKIVEEILARIDDEMKLLPPKMIKNDDGTTTPEKPPGEEYKFLARGVSVVWYWTVCVLYLANPNLAYEFNEAVERHAYETYDGFTKGERAKLLDPFQCCSGTTKPLQS